MWNETENRECLPFFPICDKFQAASCLTPPSLQWSLILCIAASPRCLWFQELNYSATFVDVVLQVNAAELCSSWNCSSSLTTRRGTHHHRLYTARAKEFHSLMKSLVFQERVNSLKYPLTMAWSNLTTSCAFENYQISLIVKLMNESCFFLNIVHIIIFVYVYGFLR